MRFGVDFYCAFDSHSICDTLRNILCKKIKLIYEKNFFFDVGFCGCAVRCPRNA